MHWVDEFPGDMWVLKDDHNNWLITLFQTEDYGIFTIGTSGHMHFVFENEEIRSAKTWGEAKNFVDAGLSNWVYNHFLKEE